jgi:hypothetical protein
MDDKDQVSPTGSLRKNSGKPQLSYIDPEFLLGMAQVLTIGSKKYSPMNWAKGNYYTVPYDSAMRHIFAFMKGEEFDKESLEHHLYHAAVNLYFMWYYSKHYPELDDRHFKTSENGVEYGEREEDKKRTEE